jgi:hypothetical protein
MATFLLVHGAWQGGWAWGRVIPLKKTFIRPMEGSASHIATIERIWAQGDWDYRELPTGHEAMVTMPEELAALLNEVAG